MYRVEVYNGYTAQWVDGFNVSPDFDIVNDYISPAPFQVPTGRQTKAQLFNTCTIADYDTNSWLFMGFISDIERTDTGDILTVSPPILMFNHMAYQEAGNYTWGESIRRQIFADYEASRYVIKKWPVAYNSSYPWGNWGDVATDYGRELMTTTDAIIRAAKSKGLFMRFSLGNSTSNLGRVYYGYRAKSGAPRTLELNLPFIIEKSITETNTGAPNIAILYLTTGGYYEAIRLNGTVYYNFDETAEHFWELKDQIQQPRAVSQTIEQGGGAEELRQKLAQMLPAEDDGYIITITVAERPKLLSTGGIGQQFRLIDGDREYIAYYTAFSYNANGTVSYTFGMARQNLTQILNSRGM